MTRTRAKLGDVFAVELDDLRRKYFQYVADDLTQLNSRVIRAFKTAHHLNEIPDLNQIVRDEVEFYAHVFLKGGLKLGCWHKVGNVPEVGKVEKLFRSSNDYGNPQIKVSENWHVWRINEPFVTVGKLEGQNQNSEIGIVVAPNDIVERMQTGKYKFVFPAY